MNYVKMFGKGILGLLTGLVAVVVLGIAQSVSNYNPTICSETVVENCTPQFVASAWLTVVPAVVGALTAFSNWIKHKDK